MHGTSISGQDDRDEMGICLEPPELVTGLVRSRGESAATDRRSLRAVRAPHGVGRQGGLANRSGAGDLDVVIYSARSGRVSLWPGTRRSCWCSSCPMRRWSTATRSVRSSSTAHRFVSKQAAQRFLGYLQAQKAAMTGEFGATPTGPNSSRFTATTPSTPYHALRLGYRGIEAVDPPDASPCRCRSRSARTCGRSVAVRSGWRRLSTPCPGPPTVELTNLKESSALPDEPDRRWARPVAPPLPPQLLGPCSRRATDPPADCVTNPARPCHIPRRPRVETVWPSPPDPPRRCSSGWRSPCSGSP